MSDVDTIIAHVVHGKGSVHGPCSSNGLTGFFAGKIAFAALWLMLDACFSLLKMNDKCNQKIATCLLALFFAAALVDLGLEVNSFTCALSAPLGLKITWVVLWTITKTVAIFREIKGYCNARRENAVSAGAPAAVPAPAPAGELVGNEVELGSLRAEDATTQSVTATTTNDDSSIRMATARAHQPSESAGARRGLPIPPPS